MADIDFKALATAALGRAKDLLEQWLPDGHWAGPEFKAMNPTRADRKAGSFSINGVTGAWGDFATGDAGGDLVSLYAYLFCGEDQVEAAKALAEILNMPEAVPPLEKGQGRKKRASKPVEKQEVEKAPRKRSTDWMPVQPVPDDAPPPPVAHEFRGIPERSWCYRNEAGQVLGFICRFAKSDGGKDIVPLTWCLHEVTGASAWRWLAFPEPRPLYGLEGLTAKPEATVLVVEGEKCRDAAQGELPDLVVISWPGGSNAVDKADWSPLKGRKVITWGDTDSQREKLSKEEKAAGLDPLGKPYLPREKQPGHKAMAQVRTILSLLDCRIWDIPLDQPGQAPDGWDVADSIEAGMRGDDLARWVREHAQPCRAAETIPTAPDAGAGRGWEGPPSEDSEWRDRLLWVKGDLDDCLANVYDILANRQEWQGVIAFDEFACRTVKLKAPPYAGGVDGEWEGSDDSRAAIWLTRQEGITPSSTRVAEAVETLAQANRVHPVRQWLRALPAWDGESRIEGWLVKYLGVKDSEYVRKVCRYYLLGMIARVMVPGVKFDYCLVLEGLQGKGKSTALRILGGQWYADTDLDLHNKDSMAALQGVWLYEFAELGSVARAEATKQKSFLSRQVDKYRPVYGRRDIQVPRQVVFAGTTNDWEWNKDPTGGRRFWPVECADLLDLEGLAQVREQLFAEALQAYDAKERYWPDGEEQARLFDPEQLKREQPDSLVDALHDWVDTQVAAFSVATAIMSGLGMSADKLTRDIQTRVGIALRKLGCTKIEKRNGMVRYWYQPPTRKAALSEVAAPKHAEEEADYVSF